MDIKISTLFVVKEKATQVCDLNQVPGSSAILSCLFVNEVHHNSVAVFKTSKYWILRKEALCLGVWGGRLAWNKDKFYLLLAFTLGTIVGKEWVFQNLSFHSVLGDMSQHIPSNKSIAWILSSLDFFIFLLLYGFQKGEEERKDKTPVIH